METIGAFIRRTRIEKETSLRQLAKAAGISPTYLSHIEVEKAPPPAPDKLERIADELGIDRATLLLMAGRCSSRTAEAIEARPELRQLVELAFAMDEREVSKLVQELNDRHASPQLQRRLRC